jgi:predicted ribosome-associated RNA-binding protein Tma20
MSNIQKNEELYKMTKDELTMATSKTLDMNNCKQYCIEDLEYIVKNTNILLRTILKTQHLTAEFCKTYLLSGYYVVFDGDDIMIPDILKYQLHIKEEDLKN